MTESDPKPKSKGVTDSPNVGSIAFGFGATANQDSKHSQ
jgi:hypothetical protein